MANPEFRSRVAIAGVPLHAMFLPFPVACFTGALLTDIAYLQSGAVVQWTNFSQWLLAFGMLTGGIAALFALLDLLLTPRAARPPRSWLVFAGGVVVLILGLFNNLIHARDGWTGVAGAGITLSVVTVIVLAVTGFFGLRMGYVDRYRTPRGETV